MKHERIRFIMRPRLGNFDAASFPTFVIFDNDRDGAKQNIAQAANYNQLLQQIVERPTANIAPFPVGCFEKFAAFEGNLEEYLKAQAGAQLYGELRRQVAELLEIGEGDCFKSPVATSALLFQFVARGVQFPLLEQILDAVDALPT